MCWPLTNRVTFFARGRQKGWDEDRIERAWAAYVARLDAEELLRAPEPQEPTNA